MNRTIEEKAFIAANRPNVRIEKITVAPFCATKENYSKENAFFTAAALDAAESGAEIAGLEVTLHCIDVGAVYDQKYVRFDGPVYLCNMDGEEYESVKSPTKTFETVADSEGRFSVSVLCLLWKSDDVPRDYFRALCDRQALASVNNVCIGNQFVEQKTASILWDIATDGAAMIERSGIRFDLADEPYGPDLDYIEDDRPSEHTWLDSIVSRLPEDFHIDVGNADDDSF